MNPLAQVTTPERRPREESLRLAAMMALFFLVVCSVGILRPIKNSLALDGLGSTSFYKVYLVSAVVILFVPLFNRAADRFSWRWLLPAVAVFFALNLVVFRLLYVEASAAFGLVFYGWYDLFSAALVTQFFMATQLFFDARSAKRAYPMVIAGGSIGATAGGALTGFFAESLGTPNLLLVAAGLILFFGLAMPWVWGGTQKAPASASGSSSAGKRGKPGLDRGELSAVFANRHVRLIAASVLLTILVKQLVDFQFNALTKEVFESRDAVSAFQGKFNAATQWLPLVVLAGLRPALRRWGVGFTVLLLPVTMFGGTAALAIAFGLWAAVAAKGAEGAFRYSAERTAREILYVPVPDDIKLKAKAYIDVAVEKGLGKVLSALLLAVLLTFLDLRGVAVASVVLSVLWLALAIAVRREYVRTLAHAIRGRFASTRGLLVSLTDASSVPMLREALDGTSPLRTGFGLELLAQATERDVAALAPELNGLLHHEGDEIRAGALRLLARVPELADREGVRERLTDDAAAVRELAVHVLVGRTAPETGEVLRELLASEDARVRTATLAYAVAAGADFPAGVLERPWFEARAASGNGNAGARAELALAAPALRDPEEAAKVLEPLLEDPDPAVRSAALRSAGRMGRTESCGAMITALAHPSTREAAQDALLLLGSEALDPLARALLDESGDPRVRRSIPMVLSALPEQRTVDAMLHLVLAPETDQLLDFRTVKALGKLRARDATLVFDPELVEEVARRDADAAAHYASVLAALPAGNGADRTTSLLREALEEGWRERRESVFRCLGMLHPPDEIHRAFLGVAHGTRTRRANAVEWLENLLGHERFVRLAAVLEPRASARPAEPGRIAKLAADGDAWIAAVARAAGATEPGEKGMELIEKVFLLKGVDLLQGARGSHLALLASIAEEIDAPAGTCLIEAGEPSGAMYVVTQGSVVLRRAGEELRVGVEEAFGTWALIDEQPSPLEARTAEPTRALRITRADFHDLLADHSELAVGLLQGLARRMRTLVA